MKTLSKILVALLLIIMLLICASPQRFIGEAQESASDKPMEVSEVDALDAGAPEEPATEVEAVLEVTPFVGEEVTLCGKTFNTSARKLDLSSITHEDVDAACEIFAKMPYLAYVDIGDESNTLVWEDLDKLYAAAPNARFSYGFTLYGQQLNTYDKVLDFNHYTVEDNAESLVKILPYMRNCSTLDMDTCGLGNERMEEIRNAFPNIEVIWRIWMAYDYSFRTDVEKVLASKPTRGGEITNEDAQQFKYCTKLKFLDLGHNEELSDFSFISSLTDLRIAVISITAANDLTPFANCKKLFYLEAGNTKISDLSPLASCTNLQHLNVGTCFDVTDISPLYDLDLKRLWLGSGDPVPEEQVAKMRELHPGIEIDTTCPTGLEGGTVGLNEGFVMGKWKSYKQYLAADWEVFANTGLFPSQHPKSIFRIVYDAFEYALNPACYSFQEYDELYNPHESIYGNTRGTEIDFTEDPPEGQVLYLTKDTENLEAWQNLAASYTQETGVKVTVREEENLSDALSDVDAPTMFEVNGSVDLRKYGSYCYDLTDAAVTGKLTSPEYTTKENGQVLGVARDVTSYGILVNKELLGKYGFTVSDIKDYESLKTCVAAITEKRDTVGGPAAFVSAPMNDITETGFSNRLVNIPIVCEFRADGVGLKDKLDGTYMDKFHTFWDLIIYNMNCSYYDISPAATIQRTNADSCMEFIEEYAVFFIGGTESWETIEKDGRMSADNIAFIPVYMGIDDESQQGLCTGTDCYWSVNKNSSEQDINATLDFLNWLATSDEAARALADMGYVIPYNNAVESDNPLVMADREMTASGKIPITINYPALPTESWCDEVNYEMAAYSANLGDWSDIYGEIVTVWAGEYAIK